MLRLFTASGEEVALDASALDAVGALKMLLAEKHFEKRFSKFQLRLLKTGASELRDSEGLQAMDVQLIILQRGARQELRGELRRRQSG